MSDPIRISVFAEDASHAAFLIPMVHRIAESLEVSVATHLLSAEGGRPKALSQFRAWQTTATLVPTAVAPFDLVVVALDGNCSTFAKTKQSVEEIVSPAFLPRFVAACPDPHIERWFLADPQSFGEVVGKAPSVGRQKCQRAHYKKVLADTIRGAGHPPTLLHGRDFAPEIVAAMSLYRAGKQCRSLGAFIEDLRQKFRRIASLAETGRVADPGAP